MTDLPRRLAFIREAERLKTVLRSGYTSTGRQESTAEHTWRLCLLAIVLEDKLAGLDFLKLLKICVLHDLGEALHGDVPAVAQTAGGKGARERADLIALMQPLPEALRDELLALWDEYEAASSAESLAVKALDKIETLIQHAQGDNPADFDYAFNLDYGRVYTDAAPLFAELREMVDAATRRRISEPAR